MMTEHRFPDSDNDILISLRLSPAERLRLHHVKVDGIRVLVWNGVEYAHCETLTLRQCRLVYARWRRHLKRKQTPRWAHLTAERPALRLIQGGRR